MTAVVGLRGTGQFTTDFRPTNYRELYTLLEPNGSAPLNALLAMTNSESTDDPKYNHFRDELPGRTLQVNGAQTNVDTVIEVDTSTNTGYAVADTILFNTRTSELVRVTSVAGDNITVTRGVGSVVAAAMNDNDILVMVGHASTEGSGKPTAVSWDPTTDYNYTQIFKTGVSITGTMRETFLRTGSKESEAVTKALKLHMADIERAMFFGQRAIENGSTAQPRRMTGGLFNMITNVTDAATGFATANTITETEFDRLLIESIFAFGSKQKIMFAGARVVSNLQKIAKGRWQPTAVKGAYGVGMSSYETFAGDLMVYMHPMFRQLPGFDSTAVVLDLPYVGYKYMQNRDTQLLRDVQANDTDGKEHYYRTECGLELRQAKPHQIIKNWTAA